MLARKVPGEEMLVVTDLFGGSVNNEFMAALAENDFTLICGMNMPLLVEILSDANPDPAAIRAAVDSCKDSIMVCNDLLGCPVPLPDEHLVQVFRPREVL